MAERQQKLLANRITGTPRLSEQAIDDEKPTALVTRLWSVRIVGRPRKWPELRGSVALRFAERDGPGCSVQLRRAETCAGLSPGCGSLRQHVATERERAWRCGDLPPAHSRRQRDALPGCSGSLRGSGPSLPSWTGLLRHLRSCYDAKACQGPGLTPVREIADEISYARFPGDWLTTIACRCIHFFARRVLRGGWTAELGLTRVRISLVRKSDKSDLRGQACG